MQDRTGANVPSEEQVKRWVSTIEKLRQEMAVYGAGLTREERRHTLRVRPGGESVVQTLASAARKHGVTLPGITAEGMEADLLVAQRMKPVRDAAEALYQFSDDTILEASAECWYAATLYYTSLNRMTSGFPDIQAVVAEVASFFATRRHPQPEPQSP
jgi:hypothetical protein